MVRGDASISLVKNREEARARSILTSDYYLAYLLHQKKRYKHAEMAYSCRRPKFTESIDCAGQDVKLDSAIWRTALFVLSVVSEKTLASAVNTISPGKSLVNRVM